MEAGALSFRSAKRKDIATIVRLLADDPLGAQRERVADPVPSSYYRAFDAIETDPNNEVIVGEVGGAVVSVMQLTFIPNLSYQGSWRALIEGVRVASDRRGQGLGHAMLEWVVARAQERGCHMIQLTTDKRRADAQRFYEGLGFEATHVGMKLHLSQSTGD